MRRFAFSWSALAVVALAAVTAVLAVAALRAPSTGSGATPAPTGSALSNPPTVTQQPGGARDIGAPDVEPPLALVDLRHAYRGTVGTCSGGSTLERTIDGGESWQSVDAPVAALTDIDAKTSVVVTVVGADASCRPASWSSTSAGREWSGPAVTAGSWFRFPGTTKSIHAPVGVSSNPCPDVSVAVREVEGLGLLDGVLLCPEGELFSSVDGGATWSRTSVVEGAVALAWDTPAAGSVLQQGSRTCPGFQLLRSIDTGTSWQTGGCVGDESDASSQATSPSLDFVDPLNGMATVEGGVYVTTDGGLNWQVSAG